jgi:hypothetical protein
MLGQNLTLRHISKEYQISQNDSTTLSVCIITHTGGSFTGDKLGTALKLESVKLICQVNNEWTCISTTTAVSLPLWVSLRDTQFGSWGMQHSNSIFLWTSHSEALIPKPIQWRGYGLDSRGLVVPFPTVTKDYIFCKTSKTDSWPYLAVCAIYRTFSNLIRTLFAVSEG